MRQLIIASMGLWIAACSSQPRLNRVEVEAQIANCGLNFRNAVWEIRGERRPALKLTVAQMDGVTEQIMDCVTKVAVANNITPQLTPEAGR